MASRSIIFEWHEGEDAYANALVKVDALARVDARTRVDAPLFPAPGMRIHHEDEAKSLFFLGRLLIPLMALLLTSARAMLPGQMENWAAQNGVYNALLVERRARETGDDQLYASLLETDPDSTLASELMQLWQNSSAAERMSVQMEMVDVQMVGGLALAKVLVTQSIDAGLPLRYHQYRFYRQVDNQWVRTLPRPSYWGEKQRLQTDHLRFEFSARDADVVRRAAPQLDQIYLNLYAAVGIAPPQLGEKLMIRVVERDRPGWSVMQDRLNVPSYMVTVANPEMDNVAAFSQAIISNLTFHVLRQSQTARGGTRFVLWGALFPGLHSWLTKEQSGHALLWEPRMAAALQRQLAEQPQFTLNGISYGAHSGRSPWQWRTLALESIADYVVAQYGRDRLPEFIEALSRHNSWSTLIPALYNVSVAEFEAGWNQHLAQRYH